MRSTLLFRLLDPASEAIARQLSRPRGWFGLRSFSGITRHGFRFHEDAALAGAAAGAGFRDVRLLTLHGRVTEGDLVLRGAR